MASGTIGRGARRGPPAYPGARPLSLLLGVLILAGVAASFPATRVDPGALTDPRNGRATARFLGELFPPDLSARYLRRVGGLMVETLAISVSGTTLAIVAAVPLALAALRRRGEETGRAAQGTGAWALRWGIYGAARAFLNLTRAVPVLVWGLVFVIMVGLGPFAGALALAVHSAGILGKIYAEVLETADQRVVEAMRATGASEGQVTATARLPLTLPVLVSDTLFRWECNLRETTVLGLVGAGGIGTELSLSFKLSLYHDVLTLIGAALILIALVDLCGQLIRTRLLDAPAVVGGGPAEEGDDARFGFLRARFRPVEK